MSTTLHNSGFFQAHAQMISFDHATLKHIRGFSHFSDRVGSRVVSLHRATLKFRLCSLFISVIDKITLCPCDVALLSCCCSRSSDSLIPLVCRTMFVRSWSWNSNCGCNSVDHACMRQWERTDVWRSQKYWTSLDTKPQIVNSLNRNNVPVMWSSVRDTAKVKDWFHKIKVYSVSKNVFVSKCKWEMLTYRLTFLIMSTLSCCQSPVPPRPCRFSADLRLGNIIKELSEKGYVWSITTLRLNKSIDKKCPRKTPVHYYNSWTVDPWQVIKVD